MIRLIGNWIAVAVLVLVVLLPTTFFWEWVFGLVGFGVPGWAFGAIYLFAVLLHTILTVLGIMASSD